MESPLSIKPLLTFGQRLQNTLSWCGLFVMIFCLSVTLAHYAYSMFQPIRWPTKWFFISSLILALVSRKWSTFAVLFSLPLLPELHIQAALIFKPSVNYFVGHPGIDVVAGFAIGQWLRVKLFERSPDWKLSDIRPSWPLGLLLSVLLVSASLATTRNLIQSSTDFSFPELVSKLVSFKLIQRIDDYYPTVDLITYGFCGIFIVALLSSLRKNKERDNVIFLPILCGLAVSACVGIFQALTKHGLPINTYGYRSENFGYAAQGFQPDLHAFAGHMILGSVGLLGLVLNTKSRATRWSAIFIASICWLALILSKSRASLIFALVIMSFFILWTFAKWPLSKYLKALILIFSALSIFFLIFSTNNHLWIIEFVNALIKIDLNDYKTLNTLSRDRLELHGAALKMGMSFPLFGIGLGNFFRLSSIESFSGSYYMMQQGGENAHNYFLQTFAELGFIGLFLFSLAFLFPFLKIQKKQFATPALFAILAIFAGNLYSHSLIIRENLFLLSAFLGLLISHSETANNSSRFFPTFAQHGLGYKCLILGILIVSLLVSHEALTSLYKLPY